MQLRHWLIITNGHQLEAHVRYSLLTDFHPNISSLYQQQNSYSALQDVVYLIDFKFIIIY